jgi:hypothetical protein
MKKLLTAIAILLLASTAFASTPDQDKAFVDNYKKAFEAKDGAALEALLYTKNADPNALEFFKMMLTSDMGAKITKIELVSLTPDEIAKAAETHPSPTGGKSMLPVKPSKKLVLNLETSDANGKSSSSSESLIAEVDGKLLIPVPITVK